ncbi:MAG: cupin domain-containing protein, partial [Rhodospirillales bacterium]|nr:cupin domain-containing protein [Rhodospirillales bacterium]
TRIKEAPPYEAVGHYEVSCLRLQGHEASETNNFWCGLSYYLPGGKADMAGSPFEKVYVVIEGELTIITEEGETVLGPLDSCHIAPDEKRAVVNQTNHVASMLVTVPNKPVQS